MKTALLILAVPVGFYVVVSALMYLSQGKLLYQPFKEYAGTPAFIGIEFEAVALTTSDGVRITGWYVPGDSDKPHILFCHGNAGNISHRIDTIFLIHQIGFPMLIFDYRGYGFSEGKPDEQGTYRDAEAAWDYLVKDRGVEPGSITVMGRSLGGAVAAWLAVEKNPGALVLESTFTSVPDLGASLYPAMPVRLLSRFSYDTQSRLPSVSCPVLVVHSRDDEIVPYSHGEKLFDAAVDPKGMLEITGSHNGGFMSSEARYTDGLRKFIMGHTR
jgi:uncharacterized protein